VAPQDYDPREELEFVTKVAQALLEVPGALCYFNPGGETIFTARELKEQLDYCAKASLPALPVWSGVRIIRMEDLPPWMVADTTGMDQLDAIDHEVCFRKGERNLNEIVSFLRNGALYTFQKGPVIETGHTMDGPGGRWKALVCRESLCPGPRCTIRWFGPGEGAVPGKLLRTGDEEPGKAKGVWGRVKGLFRRN